MNPEQLEKLPKDAQDALAEMGAHAARLSREVEAFQSRLATLGETLAEQVDWEADTEAKCSEALAEHFEFVVVEVAEKTLSKMIARREREVGRVNCGGLRMALRCLVRLAIGEIEAAKNLLDEEQIPRHNGIPTDPQFFPPPLSTGEDAKEAIGGGDSPQGDAA